MNEVSKKYLITLREIKLRKIFDKVAKKKYLIKLQIFDKLAKKYLSSWLYLYEGLVPGVGSAVPVGVAAGVAGQEPRHVGGDVRGVGEADSIALPLSSLLTLETILLCPPV